MIQLKPFTICALALQFCTVVVGAFAHVHDLTRKRSIPPISRSFTFQPKLMILRGGGEGGVVRNRSLFVGNISAVFTALATHSGSAVASALAAFRFQELIPILALSFLPYIVLRFVSDKIVNKTIRSKNPVAFEDTKYLGPASAILCQMGQLSLAVYFVELVMIFLTELGVPGLANRSRFVASFVFGNYVAYQLCRIKAVAIERVFRRYKTTWLYRQMLLNRLVDSAVYVIATIMFLDFNSIDAGVALKSILALGGVSSVVVGLALKEPAAEIIQGTNLLLPD